MPCGSEERPGSSWLACDLCCGRTSSLLGLPCSCTPCICWQELQECFDQAETIFTLKRRGDGWDDVRDSIEDFKEDRRAAIEELSGKFQKIQTSPIARWTKVRCCLRCVHTRSLQWLTFFVSGDRRRSCRERPPWR